MLPVKVLGLAIPAYLATAVFLPPQVPADFGYVAAGLFVLILAGLVSVPAARPMLVRTGMYVGATFVIYLTEQIPEKIPEKITVNLHTPMNVFFLALAVLIMLAVRFGVKRRFQTTPLDYLMVFLAFVIPFLPEMRVGDINLSVLSAKMIVMFLAFELLLDVLTERLVQFGLVSLWVLFIIGIRAWW
jgi:UDP-GlcNAc:undecaprenyl-phosphate GlcNAc-1-phosphate transferase